MNPTELAFVNQQLAAMLRCGIPLEGGLHQLCDTMTRGPLPTAVFGAERVDDDFDDAPKPGCPGGAKTPRSVPGWSWA